MYMVHHGELSLVTWVHGFYSTLRGIYLILITCAARRCAESLCLRVCALMQVSRCQSAPDITVAPMRAAANARLALDRNLNKGSEIETRECGEAYMVSLGARKRSVHKLMLPSSQGGSTRRPRRGAIL